MNIFFTEHLRETASEEFLNLPNLRRLLTKDSLNKLSQTAIYNIY